MGLYRNRWNLIWIVTGVFILWMSRPFVEPGYFLGHDTEAHVTKAQAFIQSWREGQFPVRWTGWAFDDAGTPLFTYYPSGLYLAIDGFTRLGVPFVFAFQFTYWLAWVAGGLGLALFISRFGRLAGWVSAITWWFSPYIVTEIFIRSAIPELFALAIGLFGWWSWDRWLHDAKQKFFLLTCLLFAGMVYTHLPTAVLFFPVYAGYALLLRHTRNDIRFWLSTGLMGLVSLGLVAFYAIPAVLELPLIQSEGLRSDYYGYQWHFLEWWQLFQGTWQYGYSNPGIDQDISFAQAPVQWAIVAAALIMLSLKRKTSRFGWFFVAVAFCGIFLSLDWSQGLWDRLSFIQFIQYPWRALMLFTLAIAVLAGWLTTTIQDIRLRRLYAGVALIGLLLVTIPQFKPFDRIPFEQYPFEAFTNHEPPYPKVGVETAYLPKGVTVDMSRDLPLWEITEGTGEITPMDVASARLTATTTSDQELTVRVKRWWFPGWSGRLDGQSVNLTKDEATGLNLIHVPSGNHVLELQYRGTRLEQMMNRVSLAAWVVMAILACSVWLNQLRELVRFLDKN